MSDTLVPVAVEVVFFHPVTGPVVERYDYKNPNDIACWKANEKISGLIQIRVRVLKEEPVTPELLDLIGNVREQADQVFNRLRKSWRCP